MSTVLPPPEADFYGVLSETRRILRAQMPHFLSLSVLFLLPISGLLRSAADNQSFPLKTLAFLLASSASSLLFLLSAVASITFSAFHGFHNRSAKLTSSLLSISRNLFPLLATSAAPLFCIAAVVSSFALYEFLAWKTLSLISSAASTNSPYFLAISAIGALISALALANFIANWLLVGAVVVIENRWGFDALTRSKELVSGMRWTAVSLVLFFGIPTVFVTWLNSYYFAKNGHENRWFYLMLVVQIMMIMLDLMSLMLNFGIWAVYVIWINFSPFPVNTNQWWDFAPFYAMFAPAVLAASFLLNLIAASTVLYVYCKAVRGESDQEFAGAEYDCLPFDDDERRSREQALPNQTPTLV